MKVSTRAIYVIEIFAETDDSNHIDSAGISLKTV